MQAITSKRNIVFLLVLSMIVMMFSIVPLSTVSAGSNYYVDGTNGNDNNNGTSTDSAFKTIQRAADVAIAGNTVYIRAGIYRETVTPANSGSSGNPITFDEYNGEEVTISGSDVVSGTWTQYGGSNYYISYNMSMGEQNQVFVDGSMADLARWPNNTDGDLFTHNGAVVDSGSTTSIYDANMPNQETNWYTGANVWCQAQEKWLCWGEVITGSGGGTISFPYPTDDFNPDSPDWVTANHNPGTTVGGDVNYYYISGKLGLLDKDMEWYYDSSATRLYLWVPGGGNPGSKTVEVKKRTLAFDLTSKSYITLKNIGIKAATIRVTGNYNVIDGITASYISHHSGKDMSWAITDLGPGGTGIALLGDYNTVKNSNISYSAGNGIVMGGDNNTVDNNSIHHVDYLGSYCSGIQGTDYEGTTPSGNRISRNTIYTTGRANIMIAAGLTSPWTVIYNDLSDAGKLTDDTGLIYTWGIDFLGTVIAYNKLHDFYGTCARNFAFGLYYDDGSRNIKTHHNVLYNIELQPIHFGSNDSGMYLYNITTYNTYPTMVWNRGGAYTSGNLYHNAASSKFVNAAAGDFRLVSSATDAIDTGTVASPYTDGYTGSNPDLGAYEYGGSDGVANWTAGVGSTMYFSDGWPTGGSTPTPANSNAEEESNNNLGIYILVIIGIYLIIHKVLKKKNKKQ